MRHGKRWWTVQWLVIATTVALAVIGSYEVVRNVWWEMGRSELFVRGDESAIGARVYIDNRFVGLMRADTMSFDRAWLVEEPGDSPDGAEWRWPGQAVGDTFRHRGSVWATYSKWRIPPGDHVVVIVSADGKPLAVALDAYAEFFGILVSFRREHIAAGRAAS